MAIERKTRRPAKRCVAPQIPDVSEVVIAPEVLEAFLMGRVLSADTTNDRELVRELSTIDLYMWVTEFVDLG